MRVIDLPKISMDLRLLYCVHMGGSWFGKWGYEFFCGSYGVLKGIFEDTIETLSSLKLVNATQDLSGTDQSIEMSQLLD